MLFFFFNDTATTEIYTLSLHDALPIPRRTRTPAGGAAARDRHVPDLLDRLQDERRRAPAAALPRLRRRAAGVDRKSTRLNSSHGYISYAVFCLKKKKTTPPFPALLIAV